ncbi:hypothetical protein QC760_009944 [Botrytis cinerea]
MRVENGSGSGDGNEKGVNIRLCTRLYQHAQSVEYRRWSNTDLSPGIQTSMITTHPPTCSRRTASPIRVYEHLTQYASPIPISTHHITFMHAPSEPSPSIFVT